MILVYCRYKPRQRPGPSRPPGLLLANLWYVGPGHLWRQREISTPDGIVHFDSLSCPPWDVPVRGMCSAFPAEKRVSCGR